MAVLIECLLCHRKQAVKNKRCGDCGDDLDRQKKLRETVEGPDGQKMTRGRSRYWITYLLPEGKQRKEFVGHSLTEAQDAHGKRKGQKREGNIFDMLPGARTTFRELADWYLSLRSVGKLASYRGIRRDIEKFNETFHNQTVRTLRLEDLENYREGLVDVGLSPGTIQLNLRNVQTMVQKAYDNDRIDDRALKAFRKLKPILRRGDNARTRTASVEEYLKLAQHACPHVRGMVIVAYNTGMRPGEVMGLKWSYIDREAGFIRLPAEATKERKKRDVPINRHVMEVLAGVPRAVHHDFVFTYGGEPITTQITYAFEQACIRAGITYGRDVEGGLRFHDLRASFKTNCLEAGIDKALRDRLVGHTATDMDIYYLRITDAHLKTAMARYTDWLDDQIVAQTDAQTHINA